MLYLAFRISLWLQLQKWFNMGFLLYYLTWAQGWNTRKLGQVFISHLFRKDDCYSFSKATTGCTCCCCCCCALWICFRWLHGECSSARWITGKETTMTGRTFSRWRTLSCANFIALSCSHYWKKARACHLLESLPYLYSSDLLPRGLGRVHHISMLETQPSKKKAATITLKWKSKSIDQAPWQSRIPSPGGMSWDEFLNTTEECSYIRGVPYCYCGKRCDAVKGKFRCLSAKKHR